MLDNVAKCFPNKSNTLVFPQGVDKSATYWGWGVGKTLFVFVFYHVHIYSSFYLLSFMKKSGRGRGGPLARKWCPRIRFAYQRSQQQILIINNYVCADLNEVSIRIVYMPFLCCPDNHFAIVHIIKNNESLIYNL